MATELMQATAIHVRMRLTLTAVVRAHRESVLAPWRAVYGWGEPVFIVIMALGSADLGIGPAVGRAVAWPR
jgi:hypothetical protein